VSGSLQFNRIALIGFGLIGGSIARAAREQGLAGEIVTTGTLTKAMPIAPGETWTATPKGIGLDAVRLRFV